METTLPACSDAQGPEFVIESRNFEYFRGQHQDFRRRLVL